MKELQGEMKQGGMGEGERQENSCRERRVQDKMNGKY